MLGINDGANSVSKMLMKGFGLSAATLALVLTGYVAQAQEKKVEAPKKAPPACTKLKEADCKVRTDCVFTAAVMDDKTKKVKTKASCKVAPKAPAKKVEPKKADPKK
jgi:hypothetical protein